MYTQIDSIHPFVYNHILLSYTRYWKQPSRYASIHYQKQLRLHVRHLLHSAFLLWSHFNTPHNSNEVVIPVLRIQDTKTREVRQSVQGHRANKGQARTWTQAHQMPKSVPLKWLHNPARCQIKSPRQRLCISIQVKLKWAEMYYTPETIQDRHSWGVI